eukprot:scaffold10200_cov122-Isochrysis_galbana.AAC.4
MPRNPLRRVKSIVATLMRDTRSVLFLASASSVSNSPERVPARLAARVTKYGGSSPIAVPAPQTITAGHTSTSLLKKVSVPSPWVPYGSKRQGNGVGEVTVTRCRRTSRPTAEPAHLHFRHHAHHKGPEEHDARVQAGAEADGREDAQHQPPAKLVNVQRGEVQRPTTGRGRCTAAAGDARGRRVEGGKGEVRDEPAQKQGEPHIHDRAAHHQLGQRGQRKLAQSAAKERECADRTDEQADARLACLGELGPAGRNRRLDTLVRPCADGLALWAAAARGRHCSRSITKFARTKTKMGLAIHKKTSRNTTPHTIRNALWVPQPGPKYQVMPGGEKGEVTMEGEMRSRYGGATLQSGGIVCLIAILLIVV